MKLPLCSNANDEVTDFEICGFHKNTKIYISRERNIIFSSNKKIINHTSRATLLQKIPSFVEELTFQSLKLT